MDRLACVDVPSLPLQLVLRTHPAWVDHPVAVVEEDTPKGLVTWVNEPARKHGIVPGLKYGEALSLCGQLRASVVRDEQVAHAIAGLVEVFRVFSPHIEPKEDEAGVFWLDAHGLKRVYPSLDEWADTVQRAIRNAGWRGTVSVGFSRFGSYAVAKSLGLDQTKSLISAREEQQLMARVALWQVGLQPQALAMLQKLGVRTVGQFLKLPGDGIRKRFGEQAHRLLMLASGQLQVPLQPTAEVVPCDARVDFDEPLLDVNQLVFVTKAMVRQLLDGLSSRQLAMQSLTVVLGIDRPKGEANQPMPFPIGLSEPTLDEPRVMDLVRLTLTAALTGLQPARGRFLGVRWVSLTGVGAAASQSQLALIDRPRRDPAATARGLDKLRAAFGDQSVLQVVDGPGHLPESRLNLQKLSGAPPLPRASALTTAPLIRRMRFKAELLPPRPTREPDGWLVRGSVGGPVKAVHGPFVVKGGWWQGEVQRHYFFLEMQGGEVLWCYFDGVRRRWMLQGTVE